MKCIHCMYCFPVNHGRENTGECHSCGAIEPGEAWPIVRLNDKACAAFNPNGEDCGRCHCRGWCSMIVPEANDVRIIREAAGAEREFCFPCILMSDPF